MRGALHYMRVSAIDLLVVGLPVATFRTHKAALEKLATGVHDVGRGKTVEVRKALAVALVHFAASSNKLDKLSKETSLVIDVGSRTFDWLVARGMRPVTRRSHSVNRGTFDIGQKIASEISLDIRSEYRDLDAEGSTGFGD
jgi:plasmid segregation protein ParM